MKNNRDYRICMVSDTMCDANGVSRFIQDICKCAKKEKLPFLAICATKKQCPTPNSNMKILKPFFRIKMPFYKELDLAFPLFSSLKNEIIKFNPDLLHISTPGIAGWMALYVAKKYSIPVIGIYHTDFPAYIYRNLNLKITYNITKQIMKKFYKNFNAVFIRSTAYKECLSELGFVSENIFTIPPGINKNNFSPEYKNRAYWNRTNIREDSKIALFVGRISKEKNIDFLIDIFKDITKKENDIHLVLVGLGALSKKIKKINAKNIHLLGHKEGAELSTIYASSDIFVFPSETDTLGQVVIEAICSGLPVICSDKGGPKTIIKSDKKVGYALSTSRPNIWKEKIVSILTNPIQREELSNNALKHSENFTIKRSFDFLWEKSIQSIKG